MERMVRVQMSRRVAAQWREGIRVLDQGPIYTLGTLHTRSPRVAVSDSFEVWWNRMASEWAGLLDTVVFLEAADAILLERIRGRSKPHRLKAGRCADASRSLAVLRDALERTVDRIRAHSEVSLIRVDTGRDDLARVVNRVLAELDREPDRGDTHPLQTRAAAPAAAADCS
jgi:broad-specificity NMP kinase